MKKESVLSVWAVGLVLSLLALGGCDTSQQSNWQQEKLELQTTIEAKQSEINRLRYGNEQILKLILETTGELKKCQEQLKSLEKEKAVDTSVEKPENISAERATEIKKGVLELKALREAKIRHMREKAAESNKQK